MEKIIAAAYKVKPEFVCLSGCVWQHNTKKKDDIYQ